MASKTSESRKPQASPLKNGYLILYNAVSASIWASILFRTVAVYSRHGPAAVPLAVASWTLWAQSAAGMEVFHSLLGMFFSNDLLSDMLPRALVWLRYSMFFVLYPVGILGEIRLVLLATEFWWLHSQVVPYITYAALTLYVPGE
ncbi:very-long-chain (3R)-3-hydroxyacyl-CoA dehydratase like protein [Verticillium longisporum]|nr:very-long-chain (3R)-3-hydroxyacyl-CoA dehydratase like protein [Verticillium longisporum]